jgi:hypothetical protein
VEQFSWIRHALPVLLACQVAAGYVEASPAAAEGSAVAAAGSAKHHHHKRCASRPGRELFFDDFDGPNLNTVWRGPLPDAPYRFMSVDAVYLGDSNFSFESLDGSTVIRLQNILDNTQRRGWSSSSIFSPEGPMVLEARFNTLVQSASTGIDELIELWLLDPDNLERHDFVALLAPGFGEGRDFTGASTITGAGVDVPFQFANNTWYRMVIRGSATEEVRASIYADGGTEELIGVSFGHDLSAFASGVRIGLSQSMGFPQAPFPTDVAIDWIRLTTAPPGTVTIGDCDARVPNPELPSGCAISDLVEECDEAPEKQGRYFRCVSRLTDALKEAGVITRAQKRAILRCATRRR